MHHLMLVTLEMFDNSTSLEARLRAHELLCEDNSFCGEGGRFGCPLADWFVIGGRWSGTLPEAVLGQPYRDAFEREFPEFTTGYFPASLVEQRKTKLNRLWRRFGGSGNHPLARSGYEDGNYGADDDAMAVDQFLYDRFLKPHAGSATNVGGHEPTDFADLDGDTVDDSFIGSKWLVVVDYHN